MLFGGMCHCCLLPSENWQASHKEEAKKDFSLSRVVLRRITDSRDGLDASLRTFFFFFIFILVLKLLTSADVHVIHYNDHLHLHLQV